MLGEEISQGNNNINNNKWLPDKTWNRAEESYEKF